MHWILKRSQGWVLPSAALLLTGSSVLVFLALAWLDLAEDRTRRAHDVLVTVNRCLSELGRLVGAPPEAGRPPGNGDPRHVIRSTLATLEALAGKEPAARRTIDRIRGTVAVNRAPRPAPETRSGRVETGPAGGAASPPPTTGEMLAVMQHLQVFGENVARGIGAEGRRLHRIAVSAVLGAGLAGLLGLWLAGYALGGWRQAAPRRVDPVDPRAASTRPAAAPGGQHGFLSLVSHEIRTPLHAILGFAELLRGSITTPKERQYVDAISSSGRSLVALFNDMIELSLLQAGRFRARRRPTSVEAVCAKVRSMLVQEARERGVELLLCVHDNVPPVLLLDGARLRLILFNLLGQRLRSTRRDVLAIDVSAALNAGDETTVNLRLRVSDRTARAAPPRRRGREPVPGRPAADELESDRAWLSLSVTRRLVRMLGGRIEMARSLRAGTAVVIRFPGVPISAAHPQEHALPTGGVDFMDLRPSVVLVVDELRINRELVAFHLEGTHHRVLQAARLEEAIDAVRVLRPDVMLADIRQIGTDTHAVQARLERIAEFRGLPVLATIASGRAEEEELRLGRVFAGCLAKPVTRRGLFHELARFLPPAVPAQVLAPGPARPEFGPLPDEDSQPPPPALIERLRELERDVWPGIAASMGVQETTGFAEMLLDLARASQCAPLRSFAQQLLAQVSSFEVGSVDATLQAFPHLVHRLAARARVSQS